MVQRQRPDRFGSSMSNANTDSAHQIYKIKISNGVYWKSGYRSYFLLADIGGGLIHGNALDFAQDQSKKIILAHKAGPLTKQEKAIGSDATFGAVEGLNF